MSAKNFDLDSINESIVVTGLSEFGNEFNPEKVEWEKQLYGYNLTPDPEPIPEPPPEPVLPPLHPSELPAQLDLPQTIKLVQQILSDQITTDMNRLRSEMDEKFAEEAAKRRVIKNSLLQVVAHVQSLKEVPPKKRGILSRIFRRKKTDSQPKPRDVDV